MRSKVKYVTGIILFLLALLVAYCFFGKDRTEIDIKNDPVTENAENIKVESEAGSTVSVDAEKSDVQKMDNPVMSTVITEDKHFASDMEIDDLTDVPSNDNKGNNTYTDSSTSIDKLPAKDEGYFDNEGNKENPDEEIKCVPEDGIKITDGKIVLPVVPF